MNLNFLKASAVFMFFAVAIGAFGAHALDAILEQNQRFDTFDTASSYHFYHALALLFLSFVPNQSKSKFLTWAYFLIISGIILFSGSLYLLSITNIRWLGAITPIGGLAFILAWLCVFLYAKNEQRNR